MEISLYRVVDEDFLLAIWKFLKISFIGHQYDEAAGTRIVVRRIIRRRFELGVLYNSQLLSSPTTGDRYSSANIQARSLLKTALIYQKMPRIKRNLTP